MRIYRGNIEVPSLENDCIIQSSIILHSVSHTPHTFEQFVALNNEFRCKHVANSCPSSKTLGQQQQDIGSYTVDTRQCHQNYSTVISAQPH